jgi:predicted RNase H-like nuclease (RuvC/YqgF family)
MELLEEPMKKRAEETERLRRPTCVQPPKKPRPSIEEVDEQAARAAARRMVEEMAEEERRFKDGVYEMAREVLRLRARVEDLEFRVGNGVGRPGQDQNFALLIGPSARA